jgi:3-hydroxyisobutyrate dehydrogenase
VSAVTSVCVLGTGLMGAGMARSLARAGLQVTAWNRDGAKAQPLAADGITVAEKPEDAVRGASVVLTMLFDAESVIAVMNDALAAFDDGAVWVQTSTVGIEGTAALVELARERGVGFVDAPVLGTRQPAEDGKLTVLAAGPSDLRDVVAPVFDAIGARTVWVGEEPGDAHRLKLVCNAWVLSVVAGTAQSIALAGDLGLDPQLFLDAIGGGALDSPYTQLKGKAMMAGDYPAAFALGGAVKDAALVADALRGAGTDARLMTVLHALFADAAEAGHTQKDMAAVVEVIRADDRSASSAQTLTP